MYRGRKLSIASPGNPEFACLVLLWFADAVPVGGTVPLQRGPGGASCPQRCSQFSCILQVRHRGCLSRGSKQKTANTMGEPAVPADSIRQECSLLGVTWAIDECRGRLLEGRKKDWGA